MDRRKFAFSIVASAVLAGCGGGGGDGSAPAAPVTDPVVPPVVPPVIVPPAGPELASATTLRASTVMLQTLSSANTRDEYAPGQPNAWDLSDDFSIDDGGDDEWDGALTLEVVVGGSSQPFPSDQTYAELTSYGPALGAADGVRTVSFTSDTHFGTGNGTTWAFLHGVPDARLQQTLDLTSAAGHGVNLTWTGSTSLGGTDFSDETYFMQVVVRDTAGNLLQTLYFEDQTGSTGTWGSGSLNAFAGQTIVLSFEQSANGWSYTIIDDVSVQDVVTPHEFVVNGDFEAGGTSWTVPDTRVVQNLTSGVRTVNGLDVQRSFFTQPNALWGRTTDVFHNTGASAITATIRYTTNMGSDGYGIIYPTPTATTKAITSWDGSTGDRDVALVFGGADRATYQSSPAIGTSSGDDNIYFEYDITVAAGASVTLVNFLVMTGDNTVLTATDINARATNADNAAADVANNFRTNFAYQRGLTQAQLDTLKNF